MSLSKIIRKGGEPHQVYTLGPIGAAVPPPLQDDFRPIQLGGEEPVEVEVEEPVAPTCIPEEEAERRVQQAYADGVRKGRQQAEADFAKVSEALAQALLATGSLRAQLLHEAEDDLLKLSVLIARKVMMREFAYDPGIMAGLVQGAVELASDGAEIVVRLNPEEYTVVAQCREFEELSRDKRRVTLKPDPAVGRAGCVVETVRGNIDAGVDAQLEEILRRLTEERNAKGEGPADD